MKALALRATLLVCQIQLAGETITVLDHVDKQVVYLQPHRAMIEAGSGGKLLELIDAPPVVHLPLIVPRFDAANNAWALDIKNAGPTGVSIVGKTSFNVEVKVGQTIHIIANGSAYALKR